MSATYPMTEPFDPDDYLKWSLEQERLANEKELTIEDLIPAACLEPAPNEIESAPPLDSTLKPMTDDELAETFGPDGYAILTRATDAEMYLQIFRCWLLDIPSWRASRIAAEQQVFLQTWVANPAEKN
jgi:hypothetical protein